MRHETCKLNAREACQALTAEELSPEPRSPKPWPLEPAKSEISPLKGNLKA